MFITPQWAFSHHYSAERKTHNLYCVMYVCVCVCFKFEVPTLFSCARWKSSSSSSSSDWWNEAHQESQCTSTRGVKGALLDSSRELSGWRVDRLLCHIGVLYIRRRFPACCCNEHSLKGLSIFFVTSHQPSGPGYFPFHFYLYFQGKGQKPDKLPQPLWPLLSHQTCWGRIDLGWGGGGWMKK